ncbi:hypothetical protein, partial [Streptomyces sp. NPDC052015]|uniref:hypothetical protein n=1 Tax=Streptomyces sp. NPDC052015 TaxID=3154755 RepID=UPI0034123081
MAGETLIRTDRFPYVPLRAVGEGVTVVGEIRTDASGADPAAAGPPVAVSVVAVSTPAGSGVAESAGEAVPSMFTAS